MIRPWHAIHPLRREAVRSRLHVLTVENKRSQISFLKQGTSISISTFRSISTSTTQTNSQSTKQPQPDSKASPTNNISGDPTNHANPGDEKQPELPQLPIKLKLKPEAERKQDTTNTTTTPPQKRKTIAEADTELLAKLEGISGEGGVSGVEYEGGKAVGLKRGVRDNMFRVI